MNTELQPEQIIVAIGSTNDLDGREERSIFRIVETNAPSKYDGFGTFTIKRIEKPPLISNRVVLVREGNLEWQLARYASGLFKSGRSSELSVAEATALFWQRIRAGELTA